jgi:hypothetical protein
MHRLMRGPPTGSAASIRSDSPACWTVEPDTLDARVPVPLPGSPKRKLREYASLDDKPLHIPSAHALVFKERDRQTRQIGKPLPGSLPESVSTFSLFLRERAE